MEEKMVRRGVLHVVSTPIGNLMDITERAQRVLQQVDVICCEDTRHSAVLLRHLGSKARLLSVHEHNERERVAQISQLLEAEKSVALISDAGTPLISDPGYVLVNQLLNAGFEVLPVPGVSALITALSVAGLPTDRFSFAGFPPAKSQARIKFFNSCRDLTYTQVFYESSHRIVASLTDLLSVVGAERQIVVGRELTKTFETFLRGNIAVVLEAIKADANQQKGEFVLIVAGADEEKSDDVSSDAKILLAELMDQLPPKRVAEIAARVFGGAKKTYYQYLLKQKQSASNHEQ